MFYILFLEDWQLHRAEKRDCFYGCHCSSGHVLSGCFTTEWGTLQSDPKSQRHIDWIWSGGKQTVKSKVPVVCMDGSCLDWCYITVDERPLFICWVFKCWPDKCKKGSLAEQGGLARTHRKKNKSMHEEINYFSFKDRIILPDLASLLIYSPSDMSVLFLLKNLWWF